MSASEFATWIYLIEGMREYRTANYDAAIDSFAKCSVDKGQVGLVADFYLAMALFRLHRPEDAETAFNRAMTIMRTSTSETPKPTDSLDVWLTVHIAHREAAELLKHPSAREEPALQPGPTTAPSAAIAPPEQVAVHPTAAAPLQENYNARISACTEALRLRPGDPSLLDKRATYFAEAGKYREAAADYAEMART